MSSDAGAGGPPLDVVMVEDNPGDARLAREAFDAVNSRVRLTVVPDGSAALERLRDSGDCVPSLVLLDLDLPGMDGLAVLRELKSDPALRQTPVVVFTTSGDPADVRELYRHHANAYMRKPSDADGYFETIERLDRFWFSAAELPRRGKA